VLRISPQHEIPSRYIWMYRLQPAGFKWAAMACGPPYRSRVSPDHEIIAYLDQHSR